jgi:hypothetical protein
VFDFGEAFSIPDKRSRGIQVLGGTYLPLRDPKTKKLNGETTKCGEEADWRLVFRKTAISVLD